ncbi:PA14 domain-containing protein, partial [Microbacterium sp. BH-3-3-3]|uniref:PA14 domain-containing protein n=1 Tax=Microbacterium sp. BH-3-3-3 TaxID=1906742 RepID=UPI0011AA93D0
MLALPRLSLVSTVATLALVVGIGVPTDAARASTEPVDTPPVSVNSAPALPATEEASVEPQVPEGALDIPDVDPVPADLPTLEPISSGGKGAAVAEWEQRSIPTSGLDVVSESESSTQYRTSSGGTVTHLSTEPTRAKDEDGDWVDVNTSVSRRGDEWTVADHPLSPVFHGGADEAPAVTVSREGHDVSFSLIGAEPGEVEAPFWWWDDWEELTYRDVSGSADLEYRVEPGAVKESLVLDAPPAWRTTWTWRIDAGSLTPSVGEADSVTFADAAGNAVLMIPTPIAFDSSGVEGQSANAEVPLRVGLWKASDGSWRYSLRADRAWLHDSARVYPVRIDPTFDTPKLATSYKSDGTRWNGILNVGNTRESGNCCTWRSVVEFDYGNVPGQFIAAAQVGVEYDGYGTTSNQKGYVQHAYGWSYNGRGPHLGYYNLSTGWADTEGDGVASRLASQLRIGDRPAFMIGGVEEWWYSHKRVKTDLRILSWDYPTVWGTKVGDGSTGVSLRPVLGVSATNPGGRPQEYAFEVATDPGMTNIIAARGWNSWQEWQVDERVLRAGTPYYWRVSLRDDLDGLWGQPTFRQSPVYRFTTNQVPLPDANTAAPGSPVTEAPTTVTTLTPQLRVNAVSDPDGPGAMTYKFKIATGSDARSGAVVSSGWVTAVNGVASWTVPAGTLQDGGVYSWTVTTNDGQDPNTENGWVRRLKTDLRLGASGPSPYDTAGAVTTNLANGNVNLSFASPTVTTLGGAMGMSFTYNSQEVANANLGLIGEYFDARVNGGAPSSYDMNDKVPVLVRTDPSVSFDWGSAAPADALPADQFMARWSGYVTLPAQYVGRDVQFGVRQDDGARLWVNGEKLVDKWSDSAQITTWGPTKTYSGSAMPFRFELYENQVVATAEAWVKIGSEQFIIPPDWFTKKVQSLPRGWGASTPISGSGASWVSAQISDSSIVLTDVTGKAHTYTKVAAGGYTAPTGEYGVLSLDGNGWVVFTDEDGTIYHFTKEGRVASATPPEDVRKAAAPQTILNANGVATEVVDPVSKSGDQYLRKVSFGYQNGDRTSCPERSSGGFAKAPVDMLCRISYPDGSESRLFYNAIGQLAAILDPGEEFTLLGYESTGGLLSQIRDAGANDSLPLTEAVSSTDAASTSIAYEGTQAVGVTLPAPDGMTASDRPSRTYGYGSGQTTVTVAGLSGPSQTVTYDAAWRQTASTSAMGVTTSQEWDAAKDLVRRTVDANGLVSTRIYDRTDRPVAAYGAAPAACFGSDGRPVSQPENVADCGIVPPSTSTTYDGGMNGLQVAYYSNTRKLAGKPEAYALGVGTADGTFEKDWGLGSPIPGTVSADNFSLRATGLITFPVAGTYQLRTSTDDGSRVWLDDVLVIDRWVDQGPTPADSTAFTVQAGDVRRVRVEYYENGWGARVDLQWKAPGASGFVAVPGSQLRPDYGLVTSTTVDDATSVSGAAAPSITTATAYTDPVVGQATVNTVDPGGLNLKSTAAYESLNGSGWLRQKSKALPAAAASGSITDAKSTTRAYFGDLEQLAADTCGVLAGTRQFGMLKSSTGPTPASGTAITTSYVYDVMGRTVGSRITGDQDWSCTTFDARGRVVKQVSAGPEGVATQTVTTVYTPTDEGSRVEVTGPPLTGSSASSITTRLDFLGRVKFYYDALGLRTVPRYENLTGRVLAQYQFNNWEMSVAQTDYTYDRDGKPLSVSFRGNKYATVTYDAKQRISKVSYRGGSALAVTWDERRGTIGSQTWSFPSAPSITDEVTRSVAGRIVRESISQGGQSFDSTYGYDAAGRLVSARIPGHELSYEFASSRGCGPNEWAGASGNRTRSVDRYTAAGGTTVQESTTQFCYDAADRLLSTAVSGAVGGSSQITDGVGAEEISYDVRGNTTRLSDLQFTYDALNQ